jgi:hypothetical protein
MAALNGFPGILPVALYRIKLSNSGDRRWIKDNLGTR